jgi:hypothetical protein
LLRKEQKLVQPLQLPPQPQLLSQQLLLLLRFFMPFIVRLRRAGKLNRLKLLQPVSLPQKMNDLVILTLRLKKKQKKLSL